MFAVLFFSFLRRVFIVVHGISLVVATELLIVMASRCGAQAPGCKGFSCFSSQALEFRLCSRGTQV